MSEGDRRRTIQSIETGLQVLDALVAAGGPAPLKQVAATAGLAASQTHRYLASFVARGLVRQDPLSGLYDMGPGAVRLGLAALARADRLRTAAEAVEAAVEETGRTGMLTLWGPQGPTIIRWFPGRPPVLTTLALGSIMPLTRSATGQVFLAHLSPQELEPVLAAQAERDAHPSDYAALRLRVRTALGASVDSTLIPGLRALAAPIFDLQGRLAAVATLVAAEPFPGERDGVDFAVLQACCRRATEALGGQWPALEASPA